MFHFIIHRCTAAVLQKWLCGHHTQFTQSFPYEFDGTRAGEEIGSIGAGFVEFTFHQIVRRIPIFNEWNFVRTIFHENLSREDAYERNMNDWSHYLYLHAEPSSKIACLTYRKTRNTYNKHLHTRNPIHANVIKRRSKKKKKKIDAILVLSLEKRHCRMDDF